MQKTSETEQQNSRMLESNKKRAFKSSEKESFLWLQHHVMNSEGEMLCDICRSYDHLGSFSVGNTNFKLETMKE